MALQRHMNIFFFFLLFSCFLFSSQASKFYVGGRDGWVLHPSENYTNWTQKNRFQINDTLVFKYKKGSDSVLVVNKDDYYNCNTKNPIKKLEEGDSEYKLDKSGPFFFISGKEQNCEKGQKLIVTVLSVKHSNTSHQNPPPPKTPLAPTQAPTPSSSHTPKVPPSLAPNSPAPSSSSPGPSIATSPISQGPVTNTPVTSPSPSFSPLISPPASSPSSLSPVTSPASAPSASPGPVPSSYGPAPEAPSPESNAPTEAPAYSPEYSSPPQPGANSPESPPTSPPTSSSSRPPPSPSPSPESGTPNAPPPAQSSGWAVTPTNVLVNLVGSVTILLSVSLGPVF